MVESFFEVLAAARYLTLREQRELCRLLSENIRYLEQLEYTKLVKLLKVGDFAAFDRVIANEVVIKVIHLSEDKTYVQGVAQDGATYIIAVNRCRML